MATIAPFKGIHYNTSKLGRLSDLITPPYDVIPAEELSKYRTRSPYNFIKLTLPEGDYIQANSLIAQWKTQDIFKTDPAPSYYLYRQSFEVNGKRHVRDTLMCLVLLEEFSTGNVRPHENTFGKYKEDRLNLLRATSHNDSHIFGMVKDPEGFLSSQCESWQFDPALLSARTDDGVEHQVWRREAARAPSIADFFEKTPIYIVDGHHRYESSLMYAREKGAYQKRERPEAWMLFSIANCFDPGLVVLPTHRILRNPPAKPDQKLLEKNFEFTPADFDEIRRFTLEESDTSTFAVFLNGKTFLVAPRTPPSDSPLSNLSVYWSDSVFMKEYGIVDSNRRDFVFYERELEKAWAMRQESAAIIFHAPPPINAVTSIADAKEFMPQKSTFFYPKLAAGLIFRELV